jgi:hypothetical protein
MYAKNIQCPECNEKISASSIKCECGWRKNKNNFSDSTRCEFEKRDGSAPGCLQSGFLSWGNPDGDGFLRSEESRKSWREFEAIFWSGRKTICEAHYEIFRIKR